MFLRANQVLLQVSDNAKLNGNLDIVWVGRDKSATITFSGTRVEVDLKKNSLLHNAIRTMSQEYIVGPRPLLDEFDSNEPTTGTEKTRPVPFLPFKRESRTRYIAFRSDDLPLTQYVEEYNLEVIFLIISRLDL